MPEQPIGLLCTRLAGYWLGKSSRARLDQRSLSVEMKVAYRSATRSLLYITVGLIPVFLGLARGVILPNQPIQI